MWKEGRTVDITILRPWTHSSKDRQLLTAKGRNFLSKARVYDKMSCNLFLKKQYWLTPHSWSHRTNEFINCDKLQSLFFLSYNESSVAIQWTVSEIGFNRRDFEISGKFCCLPSGFFVHLVFLLLINGSNSLVSVTLVSLYLDCFTSREKKQRTLNRST